MARIKIHTPKQALPITKKLLLQMYKILDMSNLDHIVYWSLFFIAFFTMSRNSNLVITSRREKIKCVTRDDIMMGNNSLLVIFKWSKTNQYGSRIHKIPLNKLVGSPLCPVSAYTWMCQLIPMGGTHPTFCLAKNNAVSPVTYSDLHNFRRGLLAKLGYNPQVFSSHSFRRGAASHAFKSGVSTNMIQAINWRLVE